jgi:hypothetical protein
MIRVGFFRKVIETTLRAGLYSADAGPRNYPMELGEKGRLAFGRVLYAARRPCSKGAGGLSPGVLTLGTLKINGSPCRGERCCYQMNRAPIAAQKSECAIETCYPWTIGPYFRLVRLGRSIWRAFRARKDKDRSAE